MIKRRKSSIAIFIILTLSFMALPPVFGQGQKAYIDPGFEMLMKLYPRNKAIINPMVPRIHASTAYQLYMSGKAIFFAAGSANMALFPGAILISDQNRMTSNPPLEFLESNKGKLFVIYCHCDAEQYSSLIALRWMQKGVKGVTTVYSGEWAMRSAGFPFPKPQKR